MESSPPPPLRIIPFVRRQLYGITAVVLLTLLALAGVLTSALVAGVPALPGWALALIAVSIPLFGIAGAVMVSRLRSDDPAVILDEEGIRDRSFFLPQIQIRWEEIEGFEIAGSERVRVLMIRVEDMEPIIARISAGPFWRWRVIKPFRLRIRSHLIVETFLPISVEELLRHIEETLDALSYDL